jgi:Putative zinc-finger
MNDCTNAEIRDQLPDLLHDRLTVSVRDVVVAHVADCADCREELELLRGVRVALLARTPGVDVGQIVASLPKPTGGQAMPVAPLAPVVPITAARSRRLMRVDWRIAAAVTFLAVGGSSVALLERTPSANRAFPDTNIVATVPQQMPQALPQPATSAAASRAPATVASRVDSVSASAATEVASASSSSSADDEQAAADVSPGGRFAGLTEAQLQALLGDIGQLPDVPVTEPEPVSIDVTPASPKGSGGQ